MTVGYKMPKRLSDLSCGQMVNDVTSVPTDWHMSHNKDMSGQTIGKMGGDWVLCYANS